MALAIEATCDLPDCALAVRLVDGDQVLAERKFARNEVAPIVDEDNFEGAVRTLFPEFGTVPDGVAT